MKKISGLVIVFTIFLTNYCFGQSETKEYFVKQILLQSPFALYKKIYLSDTARGWGKFDFLDSMTILNTQVKEKIPDSILTQIVINSTGNFSEKWGVIPNVKVINSKARKFTKQKSRSTMYRRETAFISNVVFDNSQTFAMIRMGRVCGVNCGSSAVYFFKKINGKWKLLLETDHVIV